MAKQKVGNTMEVDVAGEVKVTVHFNYGPSAFVTAPSWKEVGAWIDSEIQRRMYPNDDKGPEKVFVESMNPTRFTEKLIVIGGDKNE